MKRENIPDKDHVARLCSPKTIFEGEIQPSAFILRDNEESLSVNWLEYFNCSDRESEIAEIQKVYSSKLRVKVKARIAVLNVGITKENVKTESPDRRNLEFKHDSDNEDDPSHSGIYNMRPDNDMIAALILQSGYEAYPARS